MKGAQRQIADELRKRIASGALEPGAALPSVRALARKWKVAPGTAAAALQVVVREGLARSVPRSGIRVVGIPSIRASSEVTRERIVRAAIRQADRVGLSALSIRALAETLGTAPMSLYRHVEGKDHLVWLMIDAALADVPLPEVDGVGWREGLERSARQEWQVMRLHPWLAQAMHISRPGAQPSAMAFAERVMQVLSTTALTASEKLELHVLIHGFVQGLAVNVEAEASARRESGFDEDAYMQAQEHVFTSAGQTHPHFGEMLRNIPREWTLDLDRLFEQGLKALLDGMQVPVRRPARGESASRRGARLRTRATPRADPTGPGPR